MSLQAQRAIHASQLDPWLRHLAQTLAFYADEHGANIRPGLRTIAQAMGVTERAVRYGLQALIARHILIPAGRYRRLRCYRLDYARLAIYQPQAKPNPGKFTYQQQPRPRPATKEVGFLCQEPRHRQSAVNDIGDMPSGHRRYAVSPILISDLNDLNKNTGQCAPTPESSPVLEPGADAPVVPQPEPEERREEPNEEAPIAEPEPDPVFQSTPAFAVYRGLATDALQLACLERDDRPGNVAEHLKRLCAKQSLPYDVAIIRKAVDVAFVLRQKRAAATWAAAKATLGPHRDIAKVVAEACAHAQRPRDRAGIG